MVGGAWVRRGVGRPLLGPAVVAVLMIAMLSVSPSPLVRAGQAASSDVEVCKGLPRAFFDDVGDSSTPAVSIDCLVWHGIVHGVTYDRFGTAEPIRRDQLASLLDRAIAASGIVLEDPDEVQFVDVHGVHAPAIARLGAEGIIEGRSAGRFEPAAFVRRDQLAALLVRTYDRAVEGATGPGGPPGGDHQFTDIAGNVHEEAIGRALQLGLVQGTTPATYDARRPATRSQTAMVVARWLQLVAADGAGGALDFGRYDARIRTLPPSLLAEVERWTWREGCPVAPDDLRLTEVVHTDFDGIDRWGMMVVHHDHADDLAGAFGELYADGFRVARMEPIERFRGDDDASMAANNTSVFNCRRVTGGSRFSEHSYGWAIDINPIQNPYVRGGTVLPPEGREYLDRSDVRSGMLVRPGAVDAFDRIGWGWGGDWSSLADYQHLSATGR